MKRTGKMEEEARRGKGRGQGGKERRGEGKAVRRAAAR